MRGVRLDCSVAMKTGGDQQRVAAAAGSRRATAPAIANRSEYGSAAARLRQSICTTSQHLSCDGWQMFEALHPRVSLRPLAARSGSVALVLAPNTAAICGERGYRPDGAPLTL